MKSYTIIPKVICLLPYNFSIRLSHSVHMISKRHYSSFSDTDEDSKLITKPMPIFTIKNISKDSIKSHKDRLKIKQVFILLLILLMGNNILVVQKIFI